MLSAVSFLQMEALREDNAALQIVFQLIQQNPHADKGTHCQTLRCCCSSATAAFDWCALAFVQALAHPVL